MQLDSSIMNDLQIDDVDAPPAMNLNFDNKKKNKKAHVTLQLVR